MKKIIIQTLFVVMIFSAFSFFAQNVSAIEYGMLGGRPAFPDKNIENSEAWFMYNIPAGQSKQDAVEVMNLFDTPLDVMIYVADTVKSSGGGFALKQFSEENSEVGSWVKFYPDAIPGYFQKLFERKEKKIIEICKINKEEIGEQEEFVETEISDEQFSKLQDWCKGKVLIEKNFSAKERLTIPFVISIPEGADVGEHTGGILIQKKVVDNVSQEGGSSVKLSTRVGVRIYETVPGEIIKKIKIESFKVVKHFSEFSFSDWFGKEKNPKEFLIETHITNSGNVSIEHENNLQVKDLLFRKNNEDISRKFQILKGDKFIANYSWKKPFFGHYSFQAEIKYHNGSSNEIIKSDLVEMWIIPWRELTLILLVLTIIGAGVYLWKRRQNRLYGGIGWVAYKTQKNDTIASLSEKHAIDWKILAKTNKMKPPYLFIDGQIIIVPPIKGQKIEVSTVEEIKEEKVEKEKSSEAPIPKKRGRKKKVMEMKKESLDDFEILSQTLIPEEVVEEKKDNSDIEKRCEKGECTEKMKKIGGFLSKNKWILVGGIAFLSMMAVIIYLVMSLQSLKSEVIQKNNQPAPVVKIEEKPVQIVEEKKEEPKVEEAKKEEEVKKNEEVVHNKEELRVAILNGGGKPGSAGKLKSFLTEEGYEKVEASNAKGENYTGRKIYYLEGFEADAKNLSEEISSEDEKVAIEKGIPEGENESDLIIVLGK